MPPLRRFLRLSPRRIALWYAGFGIVWISLSDQVVASIAGTERLLTQLQTAKGWMFIGLSALLILGLTRSREWQLEAQRDQLETAGQELQVLHRVFRHNIRNDMNVILGFADLVHEEVEGDQRSYVSSIRETASQIVSTSEKLAVLSDVELGTEDPGTIDLVPVVTDECKRLRARRDCIEVETDLPTEARVYGDSSIAYVLRELLENAVVHNDHPPIETRVSIWLEAAASSVELHVADNGPGIPAGELDPLTSGEETQLVHSGGVGLWIAKWVCQLNGGSMRFRSGEGTGTTVSVRLERPPRLGARLSLVPTDTLVSVDA